MIQKNEVIQFATRELQRTALDDEWSFIIGKTISAVALCRYDIKRIEFSSYFLDRISIEKMKEAVHHEISHVIAGPDADHGPEWKEVMQSFGYPDASRFIQVHSLPEYRFGVYRGNELIQGFYRKPRRTLEPGLELRVL